MASVSFDSTATEIATESSALAVRSDATVGQVSNTGGRNIRDDDDVTGDFGAEDMLYPSIKIVSGMGPLAKKFRKGTIVLDGETEIGSEDQPIEVVAVKFAKEFVEVRRMGIKLDWNDDSKKTFQTAIDVVNAGGSVTKFEHPNYYGPVGKFLFLVKKPAHLAEHLNLYFPYTLGGERYVLASYIATSTSYGGTGKKLNEMKTATGSIRKVKWNFHARAASSNGNEYHKAALSPIGETPEAVQDWIASFLAN